MKTKNEKTELKEKEKIIISSKKGIIRYINNIPNEIKEMYRIKKSKINKEMLHFHKPQFVSIKINEIDLIEEDETAIDFKIGRCYFSIYKEIINTHTSIRKQNHI